MEKDCFFYETRLTTNINDIHFDGVFLNKDFDYSLKRKNAIEKEINLQSAIEEYVVE